MFTYQYIREEIKIQIFKKPFSCTYSWVIDWINLEISKLPKNSLILEMGTFVGGSTHLIAKSNPHVIIHTIDLNEYKDDNHMLEAMKIEYNLPMLTLSDILEIQKIHTEDFTNVILHTGDSKSLDINNFSIIFIDAGHSEEEIEEDLNYAWEHVIDNGYIFGDDIDSPNVYNTFMKFAKKKDVEITFYSKCAKIQKTKPISNNARNNLPDGHSAYNDILLF